MPDKVASSSVYVFDHCVVLGRELDLLLQQLRGGRDRGPSHGAQEALAKGLGQKGGDRDWSCNTLS